MRRESRERAEDLLARAPRGVFTEGMARQAGFTPKAIRYRVSTGRWQRFTGATLLDPQHPAGREPGLEHRALAATLTWPGCVVGLRTAAAILGFPVRDDGLVHVICPESRRPRRGIVPHRWQLQQCETVRLPDYRISNPRRTAIDCLAHFDSHEADSLLVWLLAYEKLSADALEEAIAARAGWTGTAQLRRLLRVARSGAWSELERRLHRLMRRAGLTGWQPNVSITAHGRIIARVDVLFEHAKLVIEADGRAYHQDFHAERARLNALSLAGYTVLRFTWHDISEEPTRVAAEIRRALRTAAGAAAGSLSNRPQ
ncbi:DUF559 domain-containing protein [Bogoriella caseilytica]|uniref:Very-short-patch-repair endonuclease n=1 Tax=Bogoriella caseilytica TaxID=56055 RepID=A0A3N2BBI1_9MICO|nr:DUF559 domain-containing protein [Bogoriella caseilytica]ROR72610.1 very-short-patch-repair endonuclease [Bogoriella caseilytica]